MERKEEKRSKTEETVQPEDAEVEEKGNKSWSEKLKWQMKNGEKVERETKTEGPLGKKMEEREAQNMKKKERRNKQGCQKNQEEQREGREITEKIPNLEYPEGAPVPQP